MRPKKVITALESLLNAGLAVMLHGSPGVGKSDVVRQIAQRRGIDLIDLRLSQLDSVDLRGVPSVKAGKTAWNVPQFLPTSGKGILFLDEINSAPQATQAAAYQLVLDRRLGEYELPDGWHIVAAGNKSTDRAIVNQMSTALKNRFAHIDFDVDLDDWCAWAYSKNVPDALISFLRFRPTLLNTFDPKNRDVMAFATPRSWEFLSRVLHTNDYETFAGIVGEGPAAELQGYLGSIGAMPDIDELLKDPTGAPVPKEPAQLYAVCAALVYRTEPKTIETIAKYIARVPNEMQVMFYKDATARMPVLLDHDVFNKWLRENKDVLF